MTYPMAQNPLAQMQLSALSLDLGDCCARLLADKSTVQALPPVPLAVIQQWAIGQGSSSKKTHKLLQILSELLLDRSLTISVAAHFRPILVDLVARLLPVGDHHLWQDQRCWPILHAFALLLAPFPEIYPIVSFFLTSPALQDTSLANSLDHLSQHESKLVLLSLARLCLASRPLAPLIESLAPATVLHSIYQDAEQWDAASRLLAIKILAMLEGLAEMSRKELEDQYIGTPPISCNRQTSGADDAAVTIVADFVVEFIVGGTLLESTNIWALSLAEKRRRDEVRKYAHEIGQAATSQQNAATPIPISHIHHMVKDVAGVLFFTPKSDIGLHPQRAAHFVLTPTHVPALARVAQALVRRLPILLTGPPASGKTLMLEHLSSLLHPAKNRGESHIVSLQLGDHSSLDAKTLIGTYTSSTRNPGTFEWVEGALTRAVRDGKWLVLEDIDKASGEILSIVKPLVEAFGSSKRLGALPELDLGPKGRVRAGSDFALFAVRSAAPTRARDASIAFSAPSFLGSSHWTEVYTSAPTDSDTFIILRESFPQLFRGRHGSETLRRMNGAWKALQVHHISSEAQSVPVSSRRQPTLRDLMKWCRRIETFSVENSLVNELLFDDQRHTERVFVEAAEIFLGAYHVSTSQAVDALFKRSAESLGLALGLTNDRAWWLLQGRTPELLMRGNSDSLDLTKSVPMLKMGRIQLARQITHSNTPSAAVPTSRSFALTRPAAVTLERVAASVALAEPVLLVGETGTGKTTSVQHLASLLGQPMVALNLSQQTEASDLLGSYKPLEPRGPAMDIHNTWFDLFEKTFSAKRNARFVQSERKALQSEKWARLVTLWKESIKMANERRERKLKLLNGVETQNQFSGPVAPLAPSTKKRKTERGQTPVSSELSPSKDAELAIETRLDDLWQSFSESVSDFAVQHASRKKNFVFTFKEGPLVTAIRDGSWVLLDEINLAASETLDSLASLLQSSESSVTLFEKGDIEPIQRHPNFRLIACMNPATDVGKKDLPPSLRSRFTELYVQSPDADREALVAIVEKYVGRLIAGDRSALLDVSECYAEIRRLSGEHLLADGANQRPHFSIRTLSRALTFASDQAGTYGLRRALWEGFIMAFTMLLDDKSAKVVRDLLERRILSRARNAHAAASFVPARPKSAKDSESEFIQVGPFWLQTGSESLDQASDYILTPSVQSKLIGLARAILARKSPVLIQGPTSAGKTSAVEYLARRTGHKFVRINNHEHTDVQEYLGSYASDPDTGRLVFHEGLLVQALRRGHWIVLDELNLAPTDVLEALNRLLDDNRELVIPETGEVVKPHPRFMLFATQNPPGIYAGRKVLSRAFRNRFLEVHFDDVPRAELEMILSERCKIPPSYANKVVAVFVELQKRRQAGRVFDTTQGFVTLRDLFRWGQREAQGYQQLAEDGYMLIAERARRSDDKLVVKEVIEDVMKVRIDEEAIYDLHGAGKDSIASRMGGMTRLKTVVEASQACGIVLTRAMQRLLCLVANCLRYDEPVLLVGETGSGKTSVCSVLAQALGRQLHTVNCHQNTDTSDLLGGQRPIRSRGALLSRARSQAEDVLTEFGQVDFSASSELVSLETISSMLLQSLTSVPDDDPRKGRGFAALQRINQASALFEWRDGPLVEAMRAGDHLLLDEMSLADDSVLERLNSVLEPGRTLVLAERSGASTDSDGALNAVQISAKDGFQVVATMNPGGDYGKKELSPALRNRFTEIWVPQVEDRRDILQILETQWRDEALELWGSKILNFAEWFTYQLGGERSASERTGIGLRDYISWVTFMNATATGITPILDGRDAFAHGALMTFIDGIGTLAATSTMTTLGLQELRRKSIHKVQELCGGCAWLTLDVNDDELVRNDDEAFGLGPFTIKKVFPQGEVNAIDFSFQAKTTAKNAVKVLRALYVPTKSILLEGSPGAGKTSLIGALAKASGNCLTRINLSDQTELIDLFGADLPVEGGGPGEFAWKDAAFLKAMESGEWVLLDEMNLASQSVLEGLNSCLDHRGTVYIPELGRSFTKHDDFRLFAAQNPHQQGGGRKGLPKSFLNRFSKVFIDELQADDIMTICRHLHPTFPSADLGRMIAFNARLHEEVMNKHSFGRQGSPWEFNLRDLLRWLTLIHSNLGLNWNRHPVDHLAALYLQRFRTQTDRRAAAVIYSALFELEYDVDHRPWPSFSSRHLQFGHVLLHRRPMISLPSQQQFALLQRHLPALEALADCVHLQWLSIIVGPAGCGKTSLIRLLASLAGRPLQEMRLNSGTDTMDVLGTFEQMDPHRSLRNALSEVRMALDGHRLQALRSTSQATIAAWSAADTCATKAMQHLAESAGLESGTDIVFTTLADTLERLAIVGDMTCFFQLASTIRRDLSDFQVNKAAGRFEWNDGPLLRAMQEGTWLLLDDANLCSASVLDRLNSLFEPDGALILNERGVVDGEIKTFRPHSDFRLFMALDPQYGELSRAMRNRGLEICLAGPSGDRQMNAGDTERLQNLDCFNPPTTIASQPAVADLDETELSRAELTRHLSQYAEYPNLTKERFLATYTSKAEIALALQTTVSTHFESLTSVAHLVQDEATQGIIQRGRDAWQFGQSIDAAFLSRQPNDLGHNPNLWNDGIQAASTVRIALGLLCDALHVQQTLHKAISDIVPHEHGNTKALSILQRSTRFADQKNDLNDMDGEASARLLYPLLRTAAAWLQSSACSMEDPDDMVGIQAISDHVAYLMKIASRPLFDFSAIQVVVGDLQTLLSRVRIADEELLDFTAALYHHVRLTSGFAMKPIWELWMPPVPFPEALPISQELTSLIARSGAQTWNKQVVATAVDVAATLRLPEYLWSITQRGDLLSLARDVILRLRNGITRPASKIANRTTWETQCLAALELSMYGLVNKDLLSMISSEGVKMIIDSSAYPLRAAVTMRQSGWLAESRDELGGPTSMDAFFAWVAPLAEDGPGCEELFRPFLLKAALFPSPASRVSMSELLIYRQQCARLAHFSSLLRPSTSSSRREKLRIELAHFVDVLLETLRKLDGSAEGDDRAILAQTTILQAQERIVAQMTTFNNHNQDENEIVSLAHLGNVYISIALEVLQLYLPNVAIDPLASLRTREWTTQEQIASREGQLRLASQAESLTTGNTSSPMITYLYDRLNQSLADQKAIVSKSSVLRQPDLALLNRFFSDVHSFTKQMLDQTKLADLRSQLQTVCNSQSIARERSLQASLQSFRSRLACDYSAVGDLCAPLLTITSMLQVGFRSLLASSHKSRAAPAKKRNEDILEALVSFPSTQSSEKFYHLELPIKVKSRGTGSVPLASLAVPMLLTVLAGLNQDIAHGKAIHAVLRLLSRSYDQLYYIWALDKERKAQAAEEEASLFKSRDLNIEDKDDPEVQEAEFKSMFPDYSEDVMDDSCFESVTDSINGGHGKTPQSYLQPEHFSRLHELHTAMFRPGARTVCRSASSLFCQMRTTLARSLIATSYEDLTEKLDKDSAALQLHLLHLETKLGSDDAPAPNFYLDANVAETSKGTEIVLAMRDRLDELVKEWPDQMIPQHIRDRCDAILRLDSASPVAKILAALEQLFAHTDDWEGYANSTNSLEVYREKIRKQISGWRLLELHSWAKLLDTQAEQHSRSVSEWWFRLFEVAVRGTQAAMAESEAKGNEHLASLVEVLDQFIRSSNFGQYEARLALISSFGQYLELLTGHAPSAESQGLDKVARVMANVTAFYSQFSTAITELYIRQRAKIETEIKDFIQLTRWKDINILSLRASAQKTHRKLHKCVRNFRAILHQPVDPILAGMNDGKSDGAADLSGKQVIAGGVPSLTFSKAQTLFLIGAPANSVSFGIERPKHLQDLSRTFQVLHGLVETQLASILCAVHVDGLQGLAAVIVDQSRALAQATPALATEANMKMIKNLTNRKRKAWTDLLRELKRIGLSPFVSPDIVSLNQDASFIYGQRMLVQSTAGDESTSRINHFFYRLLSSLPNMRNSLKAVQGDLPMSELQRGASYCEHAMSIVLKERNRMAGLLKAREALNALTTRLLKIVHHDRDMEGLKRCPPGTLSAVDDLAWLMRRVVAALSEMDSEAPKHASLSALSSDGMEGLRQRLSIDSIEAARLAGGLADLADDLRCSCSAFWTTEEVALVASAEALVARIIDQLAEWEVSIPALAALCVPTLHWLQGQSIVLSKAVDLATEEADRLPRGEIEPRLDSVITSILLIAQEIRKLPSSLSNDADAEDLADKAIQDDLRSLRDAERTLRIDEIIKQISASLSNGQQFSDIARVVPFVAAYTKMVSSHIDTSTQWLQSILRLAHITTNLVTSLCLKGFCKPPEQEDTKGADADGEGKELEGGTGLGDGTGAQDITDQMDEDETVEELQKADNEDERENGDETQREKGAREAEEDIGGHLETVSADGENEESGDENEDGHQEEPDDHVGDVDPLDPNAVDEKIWNGDADSEEQKDRSKDETAKDLDGPQGQDDSAPQQEGGKEDDKSRGESANDKGKERSEEKREEQMAADGSDPEGEGSDEDGEQQQQGEVDDEEIDAEENAGQEQKGAGRKMDESVNEGDNLDIDDELKMSDDEGGSDDGDDLGGMDLDDEPAMSEDNEPQQEFREDLPLDAPEELEKIAEEPGAAVDAQQADSEVPKNEGEGAMSDEDDHGDEGEDRPDATTAEAHADVAANEEGASQPEDNIADSQAAGDTSASAAQSQGARGRQGRQAARESFPDASEGKAEADSNSADQSETVLPPEDNASSSVAGTKANEKSLDDSNVAEQQQDDAEAEANPVKSLGDALKQFRRNLDSIAAAPPTPDTQGGKPTEDKKPDGEGMPEQGEVEHIAHDEDAEMQALGAADREEATQRLADSHIEDGDESSEVRPAGVEADQIQEMHQGQQSLQQAPLPNFDDEEAARQQSSSDQRYKQEHSSKALLPSDIQKEADQATGHQTGVDNQRMELDAPDTPMDASDGEDAEDLPDPLPEDHHSKADHDVEEELAVFRASDAAHRAAKAADLWRLYSTMTSDLAFALCEQLRLILTPTLAARLNGDFRTGKRLNMRKIVPFIASDFTKDKIWLRRTRPSKREYQVLLALDDSRSMAENRSVHLAYQTLALVSGALGRLEVGDISICRFGEKVQTLHPFGKGTFGDESGGEILSQLSFEQKGTNMVRLVEHTLTLLQEARNTRSSSSGSSAADLWQLEIIISDGVCQDHDRLRSLLRKANEQRVMIVFVIIDSLATIGSGAANGGEDKKEKQSATANSILSMSSVRYETDPTTGRMELRMERYLDTFPFTYYVVLREAEALPEVLATTLRQWAEKIREAE